MEDYRIDTALVRKLVDTQFPAWSVLPVCPMKNMGHDNRTYHLGNELLARLPSNVRYTAHVPYETLALTTLQPHLSVKIPECVGVGKSSDAFPAPWTVNRYIQGVTVSRETVPPAMEVSFARDLRQALDELHAAPAKNAPLAGAHCFYRGCSPAVYAGETYAMLEKWKQVLPVEKYRPLWDQAVSAAYTGKPVWFHGDVAVGNLLADNGRLCGLIDFGTCGAGNPACDFVMAWTFFGSSARAVFLEGLDEGTVLRAKGWALWKALISFDGSPDSPHKATLDALTGD